MQSPVPRRRFVKAFTLGTAFSTLFGKRGKLLADRRDGKSLPESQGPLRLVVPGEKVHARWVRRAQTLEIVHVGTDTRLETDGSRTK